MKSLILTLAVLGFAVFHYGAHFFITIFAIAFLIFFHELGHFLVARWCGVAVEVFSIGFGEKLVSRRFGATTWCISAIPLGGYVQLKGQSDTDPRVKNRDADSFNSVGAPRRIAILLAGPGFNLLLAFLLYLGVGAGGLERLTAQVGQVAQGAAAGVLQPGDIIRAVGGRQVREWSDIRPALEAAIAEAGGARAGAAGSVGGANSNLIAASGSNSNLTDSTAGNSNLNLNNVSAAGSNLNLNNVTAAGANSNLTATPAPAHYFPAIAVQFERGGQLHTAHITPQLRQSQNIFGEVEFRAMLGIVSSPQTQLVRYTGLDGLAFAARQTAESSALILQGLQKLVSGVVPVTEMGGIVAIADVTTKASQSSLVALALLVALISVNLGVLNLLPLPVLDGGHIVFNLYELIARREVNEKMRLVLTYASMALLLALMVFTVINDIARLGGFGGANG